MKKLAIPVFLFIVLAVGGFVWFMANITPLNSDKTLRRFIVLKGETATAIGSNLQSQGFIKSAIAFRIYSQVSQSAKNIKPGEYDLSSNLSIHAIIGKLLEGPSEVWVTIPEGLRREEIAYRFIDGFGLGGKDADTFYSQFLKLTDGDEGHLFPDTYLFPKDATATNVVKTLMGNIKLKEGVTSKELIVASILERETITNEERPIVAGILYKRLDAGWPLQADATVQYVVTSLKLRISSERLDNYWVPATHDDLSIDSPYNTYKFPGLPPAPICNPGLSSIDAAQNPVASDYWYYIHDKDGVIHYAKTLEEQSANVAKYLD